MLLDEFSSDRAADYSAGFPEYPHRGFETVTYLLHGAMRHQDHLGNTGYLRRGDVQWMNAGRGIIYSEMPEQEHGLLQGFQLWINLPSGAKMQLPRYRDIAAAEIPIVSLADGGWIKVIAGTCTGDDDRRVDGAVGEIVTRPLIFDVALATGAFLLVPVPPGHNALIYVYDGDLVLAAERRILAAGQLGRLLDGERIDLVAGTRTAKLRLLAAVLRFDSMKIILQAFYPASGVLLI